MLRALRSIKCFQDEIYHCISLYAYIIYIVCEKGIGGSAILSFSYHSPFYRRNTIQHFGGSSECHLKLLTMNFYLQLLITIKLLNLFFSFKICKHNFRTVSNGFQDTSLLHFMRRCLINLLGHKMLHTICKYFYHRQGIK